MAFQKSREPLPHPAAQKDAAPADEGVIVLAATNFPEMVDPAVTRLGHLDLTVTMSLPDRQGLEDLLTAELARLAPAPTIRAG